MLCQTLLSKGAKKHILLFAFLIYSFYISRMKTQIDRFKVNDTGQVIWGVIWLLGLLAVVTGLMIWIWGGNGVGWRIAVTGLIPFVASIIVIGTADRN